MKKTTLNLLLASLFGVAATSAVASSQYVLTVPMVSTSQAIAGISVSLSAPAALQLRVGTPISIDLNELAQVTGDDKLDLRGLTYRVVSGSLPAGVTLAGGRITGTPTSVGNHTATVQASYKTKTASAPVRIALFEIALELGELPAVNLIAGEPARIELPALQILHEPLEAQDPALVAYSLSNMPVGLRLDLSAITGTPIGPGEGTMELTARYKDVSTSTTTAWRVVRNIKNDGGVRKWSNGSVASSCLEYRQPADAYSLYEGATGDGVYQISLNGTNVNVLCDMTRDGGGWTLAMKQAQGDGTTLSGTTAYWSTGAVLNDNAGSLNTQNGNFVSAAFANLQVTDLRLEAGNESTMKYDTVSRQTPLSAFSNANRLRYTDYSQFTSVARPNWFIHATTYPTGVAITNAHFGRNILIHHVATYGDMCGARWGWVANENNVNTGAPSHDSCGGLGAYGDQYGNTHMANNRNAWQPSHLMLWVR